VAKLKTLADLGYVRTGQNLGAKRNAPVRYTLADQAQKFYQRFVEPNLSSLSRYPADRIWKEKVEPELDSYLGLEFERLARQAYDRRAGIHGLDLVEAWGRWEGTDRAGCSMEIDLLGSLPGSRMLSGSVKWNRKPLGSKAHWDHMNALSRGAAAGLKWAHEALKAESPLLYVAAGGVSPGFEEAAASSGHPIIIWELADLYDQTV
jgi:hypothetical protein